MIHLERWCAVLFCLFLWIVWFRGLFVWMQVVFFFELVWEGNVILLIEVDVVVMVVVMVVEGNFVLVGELMMVEFLYF